MKGRAIPLLWAVYRYEDIYRSQNNLEYGLLHVFRTMVSQTTEVVILADRGLGRARMARECHKLNFMYIIRVEPNVYIKAHGFSGKLSCLPIAPGRQVVYRRFKPVKQHIAVLWQPREDKPWYLMTNLEKLRAK
jgi:hypothetical protein